MSIFECLICCEQLIDPSFTPAHAVSLCRALDLCRHSKKFSSANNQRFKEESVEDELDFDFEELVQGGTYCPKCVTRVQDLTETFQQLEELQRKVNFVGQSIREELTRSYQLNCDMMEEGWTQNQEIRRKIISRLNEDQNYKTKIEDDFYMNDTFSSTLEIPNPLDTLGHDEGQIEILEAPEIILGSSFDDEDPSPPTPYSCSSEMSFEGEKFTPILDLDFPSSLPLLQTPTKRTCANESDIRPFEIIKNRKGADFIVVDSYTFMRDKFHYWKCVEARRYGCKARVTMTKNKTGVIWNGIQHCHDLERAKLPSNQTEEFDNILASDTNDEHENHSRTRGSKKKFVNPASEYLPPTSRPRLAKTKAMLRLETVESEISFPIPIPSKPNVKNLPTNQQNKTDTPKLPIKELEYVPNQKGGKLLLYEGYTYRKSMQRGDRAYWVCSKYDRGTCPARCVSFQGVIKTTNSHNHTAENASAILLREVKSKIKACAIASQDPASQIIAKAFAVEPSSELDIPSILSSPGIGDGVLSKSLSQKSLTRAINNARRGANLTPAERSQMKSKSAEIIKITCSYPECQYTVKESQQRKLMAHILKVHQGIDECFVCEKCNMGFKELTDLKSHIIVIHKRPPGEPPYPCTYCSLRFQTRYKVRAHLSRFHAKYRCPKCNFGFVSMYKFQVHLKLHEKPKPIVPSFMCDICGQSLSSLHNFRQHQLLQHPSENSPRETFPCEECGKIFLSKNNLEDHVKLVHRKEYTWTCEKCGWGCVKKSRLKEHMIIAHSERKSFVCSECGDKFKTRNGLNVHQRKHTGETPFKCNKCSQAFATSVQRIRHKAKYHSNGEVQSTQNLYY